LFAAEKPKHDTKNTGNTEKWQKPFVMKISIFICMDFSAWR